MINQSHVEVTETDVVINDTIVLRIPVSTTDEVNEKSRGSFYGTCSYKN